jgi:hypothetical protein
MAAPLYILTDARGFTTCCAASARDVAAELARVPILAPIEVSHWVRVNGHGDRLGWQRTHHARAWDGRSPLW